MHTNIYSSITAGPDARKKKQLLLYHSRPGDNQNTRQYWASPLTPETNTYHYNFYTGFLHKLLNTFKSMLSYHKKKHIFQAIWKYSELILNQEFKYLGFMPYPVTNSTWNPGQVRFPSQALVSSPIENNEGIRLPDI